MKNLLLSCTFLFVFLSSFAPKEANCIKAQNAIKGYIYTREGWSEGFLTVKRTETGYQLTSYQFDALNNGNPERISPYDYSRYNFTRVNPNNPLAVQNNFTHFVTIGDFTVYTMLN